MGYKDYKFNGHYHVEKYLGTDPHERVPYPGWLFSICKHAFQGCETLETIELPEGCVSIEEAAFENCINLQEVTLPLSLRRIDTRAFANCKKLHKLHFPRGVCNGQSQPYNDQLYVCGDSFDHCTALADENGFIVIDGKALQHLPQSEHITVTDGIWDFRADLFHNREDIRTVHLPDSLTEIFSGAFRNCKNLKKINIPDSVRKIYREAFQGCEKLFPADSDFLILDGWLCGYRGKNSHVMIPEGVAAIADGVFGKHDEIRSVSIPESVTRIGNGAFEGCTGLTKVTLPASLEVLQPAVFRDCTALCSVQLPAVLKEISQAAFARCCALCDITLPDGLTAIRSRAFLNCTNLPRLQLPDSLVHLAGDALNGTPVSLREDGLMISDGKVSGYQGTGGKVIIPEGVTEICANAFLNAAITDIRFPKSLRHIGSQAFYNCKKLTGVRFQEGLETIERLAFGNCDLREVRFPESLRTIGNDAFRENGLQEVILPIALDKLDNNVFEGCPVRSISLHEDLFGDHGVRPGEFSKWIDDYIDNNPFPYKEGALIRTRLICPDRDISRRKLTQWAEFLHLENPIIQIWCRSWDEDAPHLNADDYLPQDINYNGPYLESFSTEYLPEDWSDWGDYLVVILHRQEIENMIRADDVTVMNYLGETGPEILRQLIVLAEQTAAQKVLPQLHGLLNQYDNL